MGLEVKDDGNGESEQKEGGCSDEKWGFDVGTDSSEDMNVGMTEVLC
jgi:hypothetical protein